MVDASEVPVVPSRSKVPDWNSTVIMAMTSAGEPSSTASVSRLRTTTSALRWVSTDHWRSRPGRAGAGIDRTVVGGADGPEGAVPGTARLDQRAAQSAVDGVASSRY